MKRQNGLKAEDFISFLSAQTEATSKYNTNQEGRISLIDNSFALLLPHGSA